MSTQDEDRNTPDNIDAKTAPENAHGESTVTGQASKTEQAAKKRTRAPARKKVDTEKSQQDSDEPGQSLAGARAKAEGPEVGSESNVSQKPRRPTVKKSKSSNDASKTAATGNDGIPPVTDEALYFLRKENQTTDELLELDPASLAFVRHHHNLTASLEAMSERNHALLAKAKPASPAVQKFIDVLIKASRDKNGAHLSQAAGHGQDEVVNPQLNAGTRPSYAPRQQPILKPIPVSVRLGSVVPTPAGVQATSKSSDAVADDMSHAHQVVGTAHILMSARNGDLTEKEAAEFVLKDVQAVRAMRDDKAVALALNAMVESSHAQPAYKTEFARQAPDLVDRAAKAHESLATDWDLADSVGKSLDHVAEMAKTLSRDDGAKLAEETIAIIQRIQSDQHRRDALSFSHQIGQWQQPYKDEFSRLAPDLAALAKDAFNAQEKNWAAEEPTVVSVENSIEPSPVQLVTRQRSQETELPAPTLQRSSSSLDSSLEADQVSKTQLTNLGKRMLHAIGSATKKAGSWIAEQGGVELPVTGEDRKSAGESEVKMPVSLTPAETDKSALVPDSVMRRFLKVKDEYYFPDRTPAFSDRGTKLATRGAHTEVVTSLVEIAIARGWETITVKGTDEFRRSAWMEAAHRGLTVAGYKPTALDIAELSARPAGNSVEQGSAKEKTVAFNKQALKQREEQAPRTATENDSQQQSAKIVDPQVKEKLRDFQEKKPSFVVKKYPDLAAAYGVVEAAKRFAIEKLPESAHIEFVDMARNHVMQKIQDGEPIRGPRIYLAPVKTINANQAVGTPLGESVELGKAPREKTTARER